MLRKFSYDFKSGPLSLSELKTEQFTQGNCRLAIQYYFYKIHGIFIEPEKILNPEGYRDLGNFVIRESKFTLDSFKRLKEGDILYAEKIGNIKIPHDNNWIVSLHSAIYLGNNQIFHSSVFSKGSAIWSIEHFFQCYRPVAAKRLLK